MDAMFLFIEYPAKRRLKVNNQRKSRKYYHLPSDLSVMSKDVSVDAAMFLFNEFFSNIFSRLRLVARPLELMKKVSLTQILECSFY